MPVLYFISSFEGTILLVKNYKIQLPVFCLLFSVSIYSSRCHFLISFYRFIHPYLKNIFVVYFPLIADSPKLHYNPNNQNPLSVRKFFCECFLSKLWWFYWTLIWRPVRGRGRVLFKLAYNFYTFICSKDNIFTRNVNINYLYMLLITKNNSYHFHQVWCFTLHWNIKRQFLYLKSSTLLSWHIMQIATHHGDPYECLAYR